MARIPKNTPSVGIPLASMDEGVEIVDDVTVDDSSDDVTTVELPELPEDPDARLIRLDAETADAERKAHKLVPIRPRRTMMRVRVPSPEGAKWYNFIQNREQMVPVYVRDWLNEQGVL